MELFHAFGIEWKLLGIQMLNFAIVFFIIVRFVWKPVRGILEARQMKIEQGLHDADAAAEARHNAVVERDRIITDTRKEAGDLAAKLHAQVTEHAHEEMRKAAADADALRAHAKTDGERVKAEIIKAGEVELARMAILAAEKVLRGQGKGA
jgi:F-type H+-transporting ATPase subunit b